MSAKPTVARTVSALFVSGRSIYKHLPGVDAFDRNRGARQFAGGTPVIAHPPCRCWSKFLAGQANPPDREAEKNLGRWAVATVQRCGGVLEQPAGSKLWADAKLPAVGDFSDPFCFTIYVEQSWFGFPTPKPTWLLVCGVPSRSIQTPDFRMMDRSRVSFKDLNHFARSATTRNFATWLLGIARESWWTL